MLKLPVKEPTVLKRFYKNPAREIVCFPQGKVFKYNNDWVFFRDIYKHKSQLFRDNTWNLDHRVFYWLENHGVRPVYYFYRKNKRLYRITVQRIKNALRRKEAYKEQLNNHTQIFIPIYLWQINMGEKQEVLKLAKKWIGKETAV